MVLEPQVAELLEAPDGLFAFDCLLFIGKLVLLSVDAKVLVSRSCCAVMRRGSDENCWGGAKRGVGWVWGVLNRAASGVDNLPGKGPGP